MPQLGHRLAPALIALAAMFSWHGTTLAQGSSNTATVEEFFRTPQAQRVTLSPSGRYAAFALARGQDRVMLAVIDLEGPVQVTPVAGLRDSDVGNVWWVNDDRLAFDAREIEAHADLRPMAPGLWAVNRDGSQLRQLIRADNHDGSHTGSRALDDRQLDWDWRMLQVLDDGSSDVIVQHLITDAYRAVKQVGLARLNTRTGLSTPISSDAPPHSRDWLVDAHGRPRAVAAQADGAFQLHLKPDAEGAWKPWVKGRNLQDAEPTVLWISPKQEVHFLAPSPDGFMTLQRVAANGQLADAKTMVKLDGYDVTGPLIVDAASQQLLGLHYETDAPGSVWLNETMRKRQEQIDAQLSNTQNRILCRQCLDAPRLLVRAMSDQQPDAFFVYTVATAKLSPLLLSRPWLRDKRMGSRDLQRFKASDGLSIPTLLTWPAARSGKPLPAVVLAHGGPWVRGSRWQWEEAAQWLASRGYLVIEPEFRGSTGYGFAHFRAGWKQWGQAMQTDLAEAVDWAVKQGWADPKRVCIAGASYGGYAAMMGLIRHHDRYQCGISWVGVSDLDFLYSLHWSDMTAEQAQYGLPVLLGDREADAAMLQANSPLAQAAGIKRPILLAYGLDDRRVPIQHGSALRAAVLAHNPEVEWVTYAQEGHVWRMPATKVDFWTRVDRFLGKHLASKPAP